MAAGIVYCQLPFERGMDGSGEDQLVVFIRTSGGIYYRATRPALAGMGVEWDFICIGILYQAARAADRIDPGRSFLGGSARPELDSMDNHIGGGNWAVLGD